MKTLLTSLFLAAALGIGIYAVNAATPSTQHCGTTPKPAYCPQDDVKTAGHRGRCRYCTRCSSFAASPFDRTGRTCVCGDSYYFHD